MSATEPINAISATAHSRVRGALADFFLLVMLAVSLLYTNRMFTFIDDEVNIAAPAAQPTGVFLRSIPELVRGHEHPPLYDLLIHFWIQLTGGAMDLLRVPSIIFFVAGLFCLSRAANLLGGAEAATALLWAGLLWPYGFHFGRLAGWYSFVFLLIAALTWQYFRYRQIRSAESPGNQKAIRNVWRRVILLGLALVYANYFGWAILLLIAFDDCLTHRREPGTVKRIFITALIFVTAYAPMWPAFFGELRNVTGFHQSWRYRAANTAYNLYVAFVSESVAPWFWHFGIPAALGIFATVLLVFIKLRGEARRFLIYGAMLVAGMAFVGILYPRRLFVFAPWLLLPIAVGIGKVQNTIWRFGIALSLGVVGAIGWYGIYDHRYYATPRFFEPWQTVAREAAVAARSGATVIGNNPSFFFYLTYALHVPETGSRWRFVGIVPDTVQYPNVWRAGDWENAGRPLTAGVFWVLGMPSAPNDGMIRAANWLNSHCGARTVRHLDRDPSYDSKQKYAPEIGQLPWRVEIREYSCGPDDAQPGSAQQPLVNP